MAARSKAWVCGRSLAGGMEDSRVGCVLGRGLCVGLIQRSPTECGVSEYDREASIMRRPWPTRGCRAVGKIVVRSFTT